MGAPSGNRAKADLRTHLSTFLAMASIATNQNFKLAMPDINSWLRTLTVAVRGSAPTCIFVPIAQGFRRLNHQGGMEFNSCLLWSTACILAVSAEAPNATIVGQIADVLQLHFNGSHPVHDVSNPTACLWGLVMALVGQIQDGPVIDLNPRGTVPCPRCFSTAETLHPFGVSFRKETKPCTWCGG